jgi:hypothetical protein
VNSCVNSPEDGLVGPKHVEIRRYMNKIELETSVGFLFHINLLHISALIECHHQEVPVSVKVVSYALVRNLRHFTLRTP